MIAWLEEAGNISFSCIAYTHPHTSWLPHTHTHAELTCVSWHTQAGLQTHTHTTLTHRHTHNLTYSVRPVTARPQVKAILMKYKCVMLSHLCAPVSSLQSLVSSLQQQHSSSTWLGLITDGGIIQREQPGAGPRPAGSGSPERPERRVSERWESPTWNAVREKEGAFRCGVGMGGAFPAFALRGD